MKKSFFYLMAAIALVFASCEKDDVVTKTVVIDFEDVTLGEEGYWNGSDLSGEAVEEEAWGSMVTNYYGSFTSSNFTFNNVYTPSDWGGSWYGFAASSCTDTETRGYANQYSAKAGKGAAGSAKYALAYGDGATFNCVYPEGYTNYTLKSMYVCNGTYAYYSVLEGDDYSTAFADGDWFLVTLTGYNGETVTGTVEYYLADYRDGKTFINSDWAQIDLTPLGAPEKVTFSFTGSDTSYGYLNTPTYCFIDNIVVEMTE